MVEELFPSIQTTLVDSQVTTALASKTFLEKAFLLHELFSMGIESPKFEEGFLVLNRDGTYSYKGREEAFIEVSSNGQLRRRSGDNNYQGPKLFSEDLF